MTERRADRDKSVNTGNTGNTGNTVNTVNMGNTGNKVNIGNNTPYKSYAPYTPYTSYAPNTPHTSHATQIPSTSYPQTFYYQPFRPHTGHVNPTGMYSTLQPHVQTYGYYHHPMPVPMPFHMNPQRPFNSATGYPPSPVPVPAPAPVTILPKGATLQNNKTEKPESQKPAQPHTHVQVKKQAQTDGNISPLVSSYNLDDPEELEKWKAERRKKFPSGRKESLETAQVDESKEEGALSESDNENINNVPQKRKKTCKYFARGKCTRGDSCQFEHSISPSKPKRPNTTGTAPISSRPTIFENLLKIEEKDSMIKFYECIKLILQK